MQALAQAFSEQGGPQNLEYVTGQIGQHAPYQALPHPGAGDDHEPDGAQRIAHQLAQQHRAQPGQQTLPAAAGRREAARSLVWTG